MLLKSLSLLISLLLLIFLHKYEAKIDCSTTYLIPIFETDGCYNIYDQPTLCISLFLFTMFYCQNALLRNFITTFDLVYNTTFTCTTDSKYNEFADGYSFTNNVLELNQTQKYGVKSFLDYKFSQDEKCLNSLAVFMIGIPCTDLSLYPDLDELFGEENLSQTQDYFMAKNLHALVIWFHLDNSTISQCSDKLLNLRFHRYNKLETKFLLWEDSQETFKNICNLEIPIYPPLPDMTPRNEHFSNNTISVSISCGVVFIIIVLFVAFWIQRIKRRWRESKIEAFAFEHSQSARHLLFGRYHDEWEITPKDLKVDQGNVLGQGVFGIVYKGHLKKRQNIDVAVKFPHDSATEAARAEMLHEINLMKSLGDHENLVGIVGYVKSIENPVICTVFCSNGNLLSILKKHPLHFMFPTKCEDVEICLLLQDLLRLSIEVCNGLVYLTSLKYIHRDIAARNILLTENCTAKISDFGLCRQLGNEQDFLIDKNGKLPVKYLPYESLKEGKFSEKSDVWSFGVLMVEMFSGGQKPFEEVEIRNFVEFLEENGLPNYPKEVPKHLVQILNEKCFKKEPKERGTFVELKEELIQFYYVVKSVVK